MMNTTKTDLYEKIFNDENKIPAKNVALFFASCLTEYFDKTETGNTVKRKLTDAECARYINGFGNTFLYSLYVNAASTGEEQQARLRECNESAGDLIAYVGELK